MDRPNPLPDPVTITTFPSSLIIIIPQWADSLHEL